MKKANALSEPEKITLWKRVKRELHRSLVQPLSRKVKNQPGAVYEAITQPFEQDFEELASNVQARSQPRLIQTASNVQGRPPDPASVLAQTSGIGGGQLPAQRPTGQASQKTIELGKKLWPYDTLFQASHGGIVSVKRKGRQLVG